MSAMTRVAAAIRQMVEAEMSRVNTATPGVVVSYDPARNRAVVRPSLAKRLPDGTELPAPEIYEVPVQWQAGAGGSDTLPLAAGDRVMIQFANRSLEGWLAGNDAAPDDPRQFALSDAVAVPGGAPMGVTVDPTDWVRVFGGSELRMKPDGTVVISTGGSVLTMPRSGPVTLTGDLEVSGDVKAGTVSLRTHVHTGVQSGPAQTGQPVA